MGGGIFEGIAGGLNAGINLGNAATEGVRRKKQQEQQMMMEELAANRQLQREKRQNAMQLDNWKQQQAYTNQLKSDEANQQATNLAATLPHNQSLQRIVAPNLVGKDIPINTNPNKSSIYENPLYKKSINGLVKSNLLDNMLTADQQNQVAAQRFEQQNQLLAQKAAQQQEREDKKYERQSQLLDKRNAAASARQQYGAAHRPAPRAKAVKVSKFDELKGILQNYANQ